MFTPVRVLDFDFDCMMPSVFARRIGVRDPHWDPILYRWNWKRLVLATEPYVPKTKIELEWPQPEERDHQERETLSSYFCFVF